MTLRQDGSGTMIVELTGSRAALSAPKLKFNLKWSVAAGHFKEQTVGGEPGMQVKMIMATMGDHIDQPILELTDDRLVMLDGDGRTKYDWKRVEPMKRQHENLQQRAWMIGMRRRNTAARFRLPTHST